MIGCKVEYIFKNYLSIYNCIVVIKTLALYLSIFPERPLVDLALYTTWTVYVHLMGSLWYF